MMIRYLLVFCLSGLPLHVLAEEDEGGDVFAPKTQYIEITPEIVTNYGDSGRLHFLRARATARATGGDAAEAVRYHMAYIQNTLLMLLGGQTQEEATSMEAREKLRQEALEQINAFLQEEGEPPIDDLLFTEFLVQ